MIPISDSEKTKRFPLVNWLIITINSLVFLFELALSDEQVQMLFQIYGLIPYRYTSPEWGADSGFYPGYLPFITNMFLHGGWGHFLGNMWSLYLFGDNVEDRIGHFKYFIFYVICGLIASITHCFVHSDSIMPAIGASGAISGIMAAYMKYFPGAKLTMFLPLFIFPFFFEISAYFYITIWYLGQLFNGTFSYMLGNVGGIAFWAHIGGFIAGLLLAGIFAWNDKEVYTRYPVRRFR